MGGQADRSDGGQARASAREAGATWNLVLGVETGVGVTATAPAPRKRKVTTRPTTKEEGSRIKGCTIYRPAKGSWVSLPALGRAGARDLLRVLPGRPARGDTNPDQRRAGLAALSRTGEKMQ